jgi:hypothetical protein
MRRFIETLVILVVCYFTRSEQFISLLITIFLNFSVMNHILCGKSLKLIVFVCFSSK